MAVQRAAISRCGGSCVELTHARAGAKGEAAVFQPAPSYLGSYLARVAAFYFRVSLAYRPVWGKGAKDGQAPVWHMHASVRGRARTGASTRVARGA